MHEPIGRRFRHIRVILASASPRRRELLEKHGFQFEIMPVDCDEDASGAPEEMALDLAIRKARAAARRIDAGVVIGADTLVALDGRALGKPVSGEDALSMLRALSGNEHRVITGLCALDVKTGQARAAAVVSGVRFRPLHDAEIAAYVRSGEPMDKAGAYAIQGGAADFVASYDGSYENIIGLPTETLCAMLADMGL